MRLIFYFKQQLTLPASSVYMLAATMPRTPAERIDLSFTLRLPPDDMKFLEQRKKELEANANAEALRDVIKNLRTWFGLPAFMVDRLERERKERELTLIDYIKELLALRYQQLATGPVPPSSSSRGPTKR